MSKNKKIILISLTLIILSLTIFLLTNKKEKSEVSKEEYIKEVLETEDYSYLPEPAKEYITSKYNETGEIIKTEKNKEEGEPYLNPRYVEYISNIDRNIVNSSAISENGENIINNYDLIPKETIIDYYEGSIATTYNNEELPSSYDLRNVDGKNYVTPIKDQGNLGICWSFATNAQLESYLLKKNNQTYTSDAVIFSERQMDYGLSINGIKEYFNEKYGKRVLGNGGNFRLATDLSIDGLSFVTQDNWEDIYKNYFDKDYVYDDLSKMELKDTLNYNNSLYEVNATIEMPYLNTGNYDITSQEYLSLRESYLKTVKNYIMEYGGAYVGTGAPEYGCSFYDENLNNYIIYDNDKCSLGPHGMQIIGWDDSIEYEFCAADDVNKKYHSNNLTSCSEDRKVKGKGVWILKNSWGETKSNSYPYTYLAYDSLYTEINFITDVSLTKDKTWDYSMRLDFEVILNESRYDLESKMNYITIDINNTSKVKLEKIKFYSTDSNTTYNLFIGKINEEDNIEFEKISTIKINAPGLYNFDLSDQNIEVSGNYILAVPRLKNANFFGTTSAKYYYSIIEDNVKINTYDSSYRNKINTTLTSDYEMHVYSETLNIPSNSLIDYKLYDLDGNDISNNLSYKYNVVTNNEINSVLTISNSVKPGQYVLKTIYNNEVKCESKIYLSEIKMIEGTGTENDPYIITTPDELYMINDNMGAYYELGNDIDLTFDTSEPGGKFYNKGIGWIPIGADNDTNFYGHLDGKNHKIIGLTMNNSVFSGGLFYWISPTFKERFISIKNIIFKDINIHASEDFKLHWPAGAVLSGTISDRYGSYNGMYYIKDDVSINISNIAILDSKISGAYSVASLVADLLITKENSILISNIFSNSLIYNKYDSLSIYRGGIIGSANVENYFDSNANLKLKNIQNLGSIAVNDQIYYNVNTECGGIIGYASGKIELENIISNSTFSSNIYSNKDKLIYGSLIGNYDSVEGKLIFKNIYYTQSDNIIGSINNEFTESNVYKKDAFDLKDESLYTSWSSETEKFSDNWKIETIDGIKRIPILKFVDFEYIKAEDIDDLYEEYNTNVYNYITPKNDIIKDRTKFEIQDKSIATIDENGNIEGLKVGETILHIESEYDGYVNDINLKVKKAKYLLTFNSNYGEEKTYIQKFDDEEKNLKSLEFKKDGYKLKEWNTKRDGTGVSYNDEQLVTLTDSMTLYAIWEPIKYKISYRRSSDVWWDIDDNVYLEVELTYDAPYKLISNPFKKEGYRFGGWRFPEDGVVKIFEENEEVVNLTTEEETLYFFPEWLKNSYTIKFDPNGGHGIVQTLYAVYDIKQPLLINIFSKEGYHFKCWNTKKDGSGICYEEEEVVSNLTSVHNDEIVLYAIWEKNSDLDITEYVYDEKNNFITMIQPSTNITKYKEILKKSDSYDLKIYDRDGNELTDESLIFTGSITKILNGDFVVSEYTNIVRGDINGDGLVTSADVSKIYSYIRNTINIEEKYYLEAADVNNDKNNTTVDVSKIYSFVRKVMSLL